MKNTEMKLLIIRTSAMGDVALLTPVLRSVEMQYPDSEITLVTNPVFFPFFSSYANLKLFRADFKSKYPGFTGIIRLFFDLRKSGRFDYVLDLHDVLRSKMLRLLFILSGVPVITIKKGRKDKREIIAGMRKGRLMHSVERYYDVLARAGLTLNPVEGPWIRPTPETQEKTAIFISEKDLLHIGVAPFAKHGLKMWPENYMAALLEMIARRRKARFWLFGASEELPSLLALKSRIPGSEVIAGTLSLEEELALISRLSFMITMDSSNMHMASLCGTKVVSIWGGTDPVMGFGAWNQPDEYSIRIPVEELTCRPCTVFGKGKCKRGDLACMNWLTPEKVYEKLISLKMI